MTSQHRAEMALKRGNFTVHEEGLWLIPSFSLINPVISTTSSTFMRQPYNDNMFLVTHKKNMFLVNLITYTLLL